MDDEEAWIREKEPVVTSSNRGKDLFGAQNLVKKHALIATEIKNHEGRIDAVSQAAQRLVEEGHFAADEVKAKLGDLHDHWDQLKERCDQRRQELEDSIQAHQYFSDAAEAESWMKEKEPIAGNVDYGKGSFTLYDVHRGGFMTLRTRRRGINQKILRTSCMNCPKGRGLL